MASQKQVEANRKNATKSTGPRSAEGRAKVAGNALKHGLAGHGVIVPGEMADQIQDRKGHWWKEFRPDGPAQEWLYDRICIESVRADSCVHRVIALRDEAATRAGESWEDDRALEAEELGAGLAGKPALVQPKLLQSRHGTLWLVAQWEELDRLREVRGEWTEAASDRAMDLLGLAAEGREGAWEALVGGDDEGVGALVRDEVATLRRRLEEYLDIRDDRARSDAEVGLADDGPELRRVLRYEGEALRRLRAWTRDLRRMQDPGNGHADRGHRVPDQPAPTAGPMPPTPALGGPDRVANGEGARPIERSPRADLDPRSAPNANGSKAAESRASTATPLRSSPLGPRPARPSNRHERRAQAAINRRS